MSDIKYTSEKNISETSLSETLNRKDGLIYSVVYENKELSHDDILNYHNKIYPNIICCIEKTDKEMENYIIKLRYIYRSHIVDETLRNIIKSIHELKDNKLTIKDSVISDVSSLSDIQKYAYNKDGKMLFLFDYANDGNISQILNFSNSEDDLMDFDNPLERIDWSQVAFLENPKEYYANGLN